MVKTDLQWSIILRMKKLRKSHGISQTALAKMLQISIGQVGNTESRRYPHKYTLKQMVTFCDALGIEIEELFYPKVQPSKVTKTELITKIIEYQN